MVHRGYGIMSASSQGPSGNDGLCTTINHSSSITTTSVATNNINTNIITYSTKVQNKKQQSILQFYNKLAPTNLQSLPTPMNTR